MNRLPADEDVEGIRIEDQLTTIGMQRVPEIGRIIVAQQVQIDQPGMRLRPPSDQRAFLRLQVDGEAQPLADHRRAAGHQHVAGVKGGELGIVEHRLAVAEADLVQPHPRSRQNREAARTDLGIERTGVAGAHAVELGAAVGDGAGQQVEPPGGAFGVGHRVDALGQRQFLEQRNDVDAAFLQHRAGGEVDPVHLELRQAVGHAAASTGKERGPHPDRLGAEPQVEARGLDLPLGHRLRQADRALGDHGFDLLAGEHPGHACPLVAFAVLSKPGRARERQKPAARGRKALEHTGFCAGYFGRASRTRTCDLPSPRRTRYQAAP